MVGLAGRAASRCGHAAADLLAQPRPRGFPVALGRLGRDADGLRHFVVGQATEQPLLEDRRGAREGGRQSGQRGIERQRLVDGVFRQKRFDLVERDGRHAIAALDAPPGARMVDEHASHGVGDGGKERVTIGGLEMALRRQSDVRLVSECRRSERVCVALGSEALTGEAAEILVEQWHQAIERSRCSVAPCLERERHLARRVARPGDRRVVVSRHDGMVTRARAGHTAAVESHDLIASALRAASDTKHLSCAAGVRHDVAAIFGRPELFADREAIVVADRNTYAAAGADVLDSFRRAGARVDEPFIFGPDVYADDRCVRQLQAALQGTPGIPVAVGSGTINDLTKLVAHRLGRPYMAVATAASMDGYTAYGASITYKGSKQTFECPAPLAVAADLETIAKAPAGLNASGYADLLAKIAAGADWIVADAAGIEPIDPAVWQAVQGLLHDWVSSPDDVAAGDPVALRNLVNGLMMSGFAMQAARTSRPASGADHQFSHLWDMQHHTHDGVAPSHGFKVGIGTLASTALYDELFQRGLGATPVAELVARWPAADALEREVRRHFEPGELADKAVEETLAKYPDRERLRDQLERLRRAWPQLVPRLQAQLTPFQRLQEMLRRAGCPCEPEQIGISRQRLRTSYRQAYCIRRRFTVLDVAMLFGEFDTTVDALFAPDGSWGARATLA